jgi:hypothetical protein
MTTHLRAVLEGRYETVERAALRWAEAAESLRAEDWDRRRQWTSLAVEDSEETEAVEALERKLAQQWSEDGTALLTQYRAARSQTQQLLDKRLTAFGGSSGAPAQMVKELTSHLPLQCSHRYMISMWLMGAITTGFGAFLLVLFHPWLAVPPLVVALVLLLISVKRSDQVTVTQRVLSVNGFAMPFEQLQSVTLSYVARSYVLSVLLHDGTLRSWTFDQPLTDVVEMLRASGVKAVGCAVPHVITPARNREPSRKEADDWFDRWFSRFT